MLKYPESEALDWARAEAGTEPGKMEILTKTEDLSEVEAPLHLAIGVFDGVHLGHKMVIEAAKSNQHKNGGSVVVVTFDPHPASVLAPGKVPRLLTSTPHKARILDRDLRISHLLAIRFDEQFADLSARSFVEELCRPGAVSSISVGREFRFGKDRMGDVAMLSEISREFGFAVEACETVELDAEPVSSTRIRQAIESGDFEKARALLGRAYTVFGRVVEGCKTGRTIGFPTANLAVNSEQLPPSGVYAVYAAGSGDCWDGVANLGFRPTVSSEEKRRLLEVHLFGLRHEIYGEDLEIEFVRHLRGEKKFAGLDELKEQIAADAEQAKQILSTKL